MVAMFRRNGGRAPEVRVATLQQVYRRIPAPAAKIERPGKAPDPAVLVQIERCLSLLVLKYSRTRTQPPVPVPGWMDVRVCAKSGMPEKISRYYHQGVEIRIERLKATLGVASPAATR
ncbi:hypothetical protein [Methanoculleus bourgensis]|uniref:hypothetical protein n=1 Tax=Methanoculleus bourgensis TaxID=83986 RepID=UPI0012E06BA9|nr:hypothetical protein [Methanoculleus bourgensis]